MDTSRKRRVDRILAWYCVHSRDLAWRHLDASAWAILVSEIMLQQTPVARVQPVWERWLRTWPTPASLAAATPADVLRAWDRLGYPRRALRLREAAVVITERYDGRVPDTYAELITLPGIGDYTAAAVASFAYGRRALVLDTNVRRVLARMDAGVAFPVGSATVAERQRAAAYLPASGRRAARWNVAAMELGALVCTANHPRCDDCPVRRDCAWLDLGQPDGQPRPRPQAWAGTDRQCRGQVLAAVRRGPVSRAYALTLGKDARQAERCVESLLVDGLLEASGNLLHLPGEK